MKEVKKDKRKATKLLPDPRNTAPNTIQNSCILYL